MEKIFLQAEKRDIFGKKTKALRKEGFIPAVLYGHKIKTLPLKVDLGKFLAVQKIAGKSTLIDLKIDQQETQKVLISQYQTHPVTGKSIHVDFYQVKMTEKIKTEVPIKIVGTSKAVEEQDGNLITNKNTINIECLPSDLIPEIQVDITTLETFEDTIQIKNLRVPETITILDEPEEVVVSVTPPRSEKELEELEKEVEEEEAEKVEITSEKKPEEAEAGPKAIETGEAKTSEESQPPTPAPTTQPPSPSKPSQE